MGTHIVPEKDKYEYREIEAIPLEYPASFRPRNLCIYFTPTQRLSDFVIFCHLGVIHRNSFQVYCASGEVYNEVEYLHKQTLRLPEYAIEGDNAILQAKWLPLQIGPGSKKKVHILLMLCTRHMVYFYNEDAILLITKFDIVGDLNTEPNYTLKNFTCIDDKIYGGGASGDIYVFHYLEKLNTVKLSVIYKKVHIGKIQDITSNPKINVVASVCTEGVIQVWDVNTAMQSRIEFHVTPKDCLTNVVIWKNSVIASCDSGLIKTYDLKKKVLVSTLHAHSRAVLGMDLLPKKNLLLTISDDGWVRIWHISDSKVNLLGTVGFNFYTPVGARFLNPNGIIFGISTFGTYRVKVFGRPN